MDSYSISELCFQQTQTTMDDSFCQPPPQLVDDFGITAENVNRLADELDLELLNEFFGSSLGEDLAKDARADDSPSPYSSKSMPSTAFPSPSAPSTSTSTPSTASPPMPSSSAPAAVNTRKRKATQDRSCVNCKTPESSMWRRDPESGDTLCNACGQHLKKFKVHRPAEMFSRPIKKRCRKFKDDAPATSSKPFFPMSNFNVGMACQFQQPQPQQQPPYLYQQLQPIQPQYPMQSFHQPPPMPEVYYHYDNWQPHPSYPLPPYFQQGRW